MAQSPVQLRVHPEFTEQQVPVSRRERIEGPFRASRRKNPSIGFMLNRESPLTLAVFGFSCRGDRMDETLFGGAPPPPGVIDC